MQAPDIATTEVSDIVMASTKETRMHNIDDFLNRFHVLERFSWATTDVRGSVLKTYRFPDVLNSISSIRNKFLNFYGLRAGVHLIVQVNSQPFQAGNLMVSFLPNARYNDYKRETHEKDLQGMVSRSGAPRVNLDLMDGTRIDMKVPYASPFIFYNLFTQDGNIGDFAISVYAPLRDVAAAGTVTVTVAARFTDVQLAFPIGSALPTYGNISSLNEVTSASESLHLMPTREKAQELKNKLDNLLKLIDDGKVVFQMNNTQVSAFKQKAVPNMATINDSNITHMLSTHSDSSIVPLNMSNTGTDDMSFNHILSIPCYHDYFTVATTQASNTNVWSEQVEPLRVSDIVNTDSSLSVDYLYFISNMFRKWRGSIKYKFRVVKTKYHSLRLRVSFSPGTTTQLGVDRDSCYSEIFDLRDNNTFEFTVPYIHPYPWLDTQDGFSVSGTTSLGLIMVDIHNQMVAPTTVVNTIDVIVERCAGPDFELALPTSLQNFPFSPITAQVVGDAGIGQASYEKIPQKIAENVITSDKEKLFKFDDKVDVGFLNRLPHLPAHVKDYFQQHLNNNHFLSKANLVALDNVLECGVEFKPSMVGEDVPTLLSHLRNVAHPRHLELRSTNNKSLVISSSKPLEGMYFQSGNISSAPTTSPLQKSARMFFEGSYGSRAIALHSMIKSLPWYISIPTIILADMSLSWIFTLVNKTLENPFKKDLTTEGIEPNPGPIRTTRTLISGTQVVSLTSPFYGRQTVRLEVGVVPQLNTVDSFDCMVTSNAEPEQIDILPRAYTGAPFVSEFLWDSAIQPVLTFTGQSTGTHQNYITIQYITESPFDLQSGFQFQMRNFEQDTERDGNLERCVTQPQIVTDMAKYCMGNQIVSVKEMISRSTFLNSITPTDTRPIHIMSHGFGVSAKDANNNILISGYDNLSYFASIYAFARGGVNFRLQATGAPYRIVVDTNSDVATSTTGQDFPLFSQSGVPLDRARTLRASNLMQHVINTGVEGIGEFSVPFYCSSFCYSVDPEQDYEPANNVNNFQLPNTHVVIIPQGALSEALLYRNANSDFQFSYLTGPPLMLAII